MKILFAADVLPDPNRGAAGTELQTILGLRRLGHHVDAFWADSLPRRLQHGNLHYLLELPRTYRNLIQRTSGRTKYDVIHVNQGHAYLAARDHQRRRGKGVFVIRSHGLEDRAELVLGPWRRRLGVTSRARAKRIPGLLLDRLLARHHALAARWADGLIVSSSLDREYLLEAHSVPGERAVCIPQAPPDSFLSSPAPTLSRDRLRRLLHVGGPHLWKGYHAVAEAAGSLLREPSDFSFTWISDASPHASLPDLALVLPPERLHLQSWMDQERLIETYDRHGILLFPSLFEGFGKVFLEAMARGLVVVTTPTGGMRDIVRDGDNGLIVPFNDGTAIADRVRYLWNHPDEARLIGQRARETAESFSWDRVASETAAFYDHLRRLPRRG